MNITGPIQRNARTSPDAIAAFDRGVAVSYAGLDRLIDATAKRILAAGLRPGHAAAVLVTDQFRHLVLSLALARLGIVAVISSYAATHPGSLSIRAGFVDAGSAGSRSPASIVVDDAWWRDLSSATTVAGVEPARGGDAACLVVTSSGTTGTPKKMAQTHAILCERMFVRPLSILWPSRPRVGCLMGRESSYAFTSALRALWAGGAVMYFGPSADVRALVQQHKLDCLVASPVQLQDLVDASPGGSTPLPSLEILEVSGGMVPSRVARAARALLCPNVVTNYGANEAGNMASAPLHLLEQYPGSAGLVAPGTEMQAVDDDRRPLPPGVEGNLRIRSASCVGAYLDDPVASARAFVDGWFYPGDVGTVTAGGLVILAGRSDELLNAGGVKVSPAVIEEAARAYDGVADAAAFSATGGRSGVPQIGLAIVQRNPVDLEALGKHLLRALGPARTPRRILLVKALPRNDNGKVLRRELAAMATPKAGANRTPGKEPRSPQA